MFLNLYIIKMKKISKIFFIVFILISLKNTPLISIYPQEEYIDDFSYFKNKNVVVLWRGVHFLKEYFPSNNHTINFWEHQILEKPIYAAEIYRQAQIPVSTLKTTVRQNVMLYNIATDVQEVIKKLSEKGPILINKKNFPTYRYAFQHIYTNDYDAFGKMLQGESNKYAQLVAGLNIKKVPFVSCSESLEHALRYAAGLKYYGQNATKLATDYNALGAPKNSFLGCLYGIILDEEMVQQTSPFGVEANHKAGNIKVSTHPMCNILTEKEVSLVSYVPLKAVVLKFPFVAPSFYGEYNKTHKSQYGLTKVKFNNFKRKILKEKNSKKRNEETEKFINTNIINEKNFQVAYKNFSMSYRLRNVLKYSLKKVNAKIGYIGINGIEITSSPHLLGENYDKPLPKLLDPQEVWYDDEEIYCLLKAYAKPNFGELAPQNNYTFNSLNNNINYNIFIIRRIGNEQEFNYDFDKSTRLIEKNDQQKGKDVLDELISSFQSGYNHGRILFPYNSSNLHWMAVCIDIAAQEKELLINYFILNSLDGYKEEEANIKNWIEATLTKRLQYDYHYPLKLEDCSKNLNRFQQSDIISCGPITVYNLYKILINDFNDINPSKNIIDLRQEHINLLEDGLIKNSLIKKMEYLNGISKSISSNNIKEENSEHNLDKSDNKDKQPSNYEKTESSSLAKSPTLKQLPSNKFTISNLEDINIQTVQKIMNELRESKKLQPDIIKIIAPNINIGTNSTNIYRSLYRGARRDVSPRQCIENYLNFLKKKN